MKKPTPRYPEVYQTIIDMMVSNGFVDNGKTIDRKETGCQFDFDTLNAYESVVDFQLDWHYSFRDILVKKLRFHEHKLLNNVDQLRNQICTVSKRYAATKIVMCTAGDDFIQSKVTLIFCK